MRRWGGSPTQCTSAQARYGRGRSGRPGERRRSPTRRRTCSESSPAWRWARATIDYNGRFCMSSAAAAANRAFGLDRGLPFPLADIPLAEVVLLVGANPAETHASAACATSRPSATAGGTLIVATRGGPPPRRPRRCTCALTPGTDAALANGLLHVLVARRPGRRGYIRDARKASRQCGPCRAAYWPERVERLTGVPQADDRRDGARLLGRARTRDGPHRTWRRATGPGRHQYARLRERGAGARAARAAGQRLRHAHGPGQRPGRARARPEGRPAPGLSPHRRPAAREHVARDLGRRPRPDSRPRPVRLRDARHASARDGGVRALLVFGTNPAVSAPNGRRGRRAAGEPRPAGRVAISSSPRRRELAHVVLPVRAVGRGGRHDDQPRGPSGAATQGVRAAARRAHRHRDPVRAGAGPGSRRRVRLRPSARRSSTSCGGRRAGGPADYAGITYERIDREGGVFWPCPSEDHPGTPRLFAERFPTPSGRARFHALRPLGPAEEPDADYPPVPDHRARARALPVRARRRGVSGELAERKPRSRWRRSIPCSPRARARLRRARCALATRRGERQPSREARAPTSGTTPCSCPSTGAARNRPTADQPRARPDEPDAGVQGLRGADRKRGAEPPRRLSEVYA